MNYIFLPSLQHAAIVSTTSLIYNNKEIRKILNGESNIHIAWELVERKIIETLSSLLPVSIINIIAKVIRPMHDEVKWWKLDHGFLIEHVDENCITIFWKTDGTINRTETAKCIIKNGYINPDIRFMMACLYFLENEILSLWRRFTEVDKNRITSLGTNSAVEFWVEWLQKENATPWRDAIDGYFKTPMEMNFYYPLRLSSFFQFLSRESQKNYVGFFHIPIVHTDDFQMCLNLMDEEQRIDFFSSNSLNAFLLCLKWPFRSHFVKMAEEAFKYFSDNIFVLPLYHMLRSYYTMEYDDFEIFEEFWQLSPSVFKEKARNSKLITIVIYNIIERENLSPYLKTIVRKSFLNSL